MKKKVFGMIAVMALAGALAEDVAETIRKKQKLLLQQKRLQKKLKQKKLKQRKLKQKKRQRQKQQNNTFVPAKSKRFKESCRRWLKKPFGSSFLMDKIQMRRDF